MSKSETKSANTIFDVATDTETWETEITDDNGNTHRGLGSTSEESQKAASEKADKD